MQFSDNAATCTIPLTIEATPGELMTSALIGLTACGLYLLASGLAARQLRSRAQPRRGGFLGLGLIAWLFHLGALWPLLVRDHGLYLGLLPMASLIGAVGSALVVLSNLYRRLEWLSLLVFPFNALVLPLALFIHTGYQPQPLAHGLGAHVLFSVLAFAVLAIAASHCLLLLIQHRQLKHGHIRGMMRVLPPVQIMETMLFELIWAGVLLLTLAIGTGFLFVDDLFAQHLAHKTLFTLLSLALFITLLAGRHWLGWRGVTAVRLTIAGFALLLLGFFGSQLVLEVILQRP